MIEKFSRSWALVKASAAVLRSDKELLLFPALSALCSLLVLASFATPLFLSGALDHAARHESRPLLAAVGFAFYFVQYLVIIFFNTALVGAASIRLGGGDPGVGDGFRLALGKLPAILGYAAIAATVGLVLRAIQERSGWLGRWVAGLLGAAWTVASFLVVPVLVHEDVGPLDAVKQSVTLLKRTWGENLIGNAGFGLVFFLLMLLALVPAAVVGALAVAAKSGAGVAAAVALGVIAVLLVALVQAALQGIYAAALYRYAAQGEVGGGFDRALVAQAFRVKA